jgi:heme-degrading monooxygenase HmoA
MYARHVTVHGTPSRMDEAVRSVQERVLPVLKECAGFKGQLLLVDRDKGEAVGISLWDTEDNMRASEEKVAAARQQTADEVGAASAPEVALYELPIFETP